MRILLKKCPGGLDQNRETEYQSRELGWTSFDKPERIVMRNSENGTARGSVYEYGPEQQRLYKKEAVFSALNAVQSHGDETIYLGKYYERIENPTTGQVTHRYIIDTGGHSIQIEQQDNSNQDKTHYLLADNLGSTNVIVDTRGQVTQRLAFDPLCLLAAGVYYGADYSSGGNSAAQVHSLVSGRCRRMYMLKANER